MCLDQGKSNTLQAKGKNDMKCMLYPFSSELIPMLHPLKTVKSEWDISKLVVPAAWLNRFKDEEKICVSSNFNEALVQVSTVIICDCGKYEWLYKDIVDKIKLCIENGKKIVCCTKIRPDDLEKIRALPEYKNDLFDYLAEDEQVNTVPIMQRMHTEEGIVIGVGKLLRGVSTTAAFYSLYNSLTQKGYKVVGIGDNFNCRLVGGYKFPIAIFEAAMPEDQKVLYINNFINQIQILHSADVVLLQFPDGLLKYSDVCYEKFGIQSYILSQALSFDYFVLNIPYEAFTGESYAELSNTFKYKYGIELDTVCIENKLVDESKSQEEEKISYHFINWNEINQYISSFSNECKPIMLVSMNSPDLGDMIAEDCILKLSGQVEVF